MDRLSLDNFIALCHSAESPAIIEAQGLTAQESSNAAQRLSADSFAVRVLDGSAFHSKTDLLDGIAAAFQFPGYFGRNWDALIDCWSDMSWLPASGYICIIEKANVLERTHQEVFDALRGAVGHIAERWENTGENILFKLALVYDAQD